MSKVYKESFNNWDDVVSNFGGKCPKVEPKHVFAVYGTPAYEGHAVVITKVGRKYQVVEGSHCSCYGLEDQWEPTEHSKAEIEKMLTATYGPFSSYRTEIQAWLG
jgi:hypothetical protein